MAAGFISLYLKAFWTQTSQLARVAYLRAFGWILDFFLKRFFYNHKAPQGHLRKLQRATSLRVIS